MDGTPWNRPLFTHANSCISNNFPVILTSQQITLDFGLCLATFTSLEGCALPRGASLVLARIRYN